jgi:hypothetical protein
MRTGTWILNGIGIALLLAGCATGASYQGASTIPEGKALIYIYRLPKFVGFAIFYDVKAGETVVTTLKAGGYFPYVVSAPAEVELWARTEAKSSVTLDVKPGQIYYVKAGTSVGALVGRPRLIVVSADVGEKEIKECKLLDPPR